MRDEQAWSWSEPLIGADRDASWLAARLIAGTSVLVAGPRGSGRTHLLRAAGAELRLRGVTPAVVRPSAVLADVSLAALEATGDPRIAALRAGVTGNDPAPIVVIDDIHLLDDASVTAIARAASTGRATVLLALTVPRARAEATRLDDEGPAAVMLRLWLDGFADRVDLSELSTEDGERLLAAFPGASGLDAATTAGLLWRADGSRTLLRELVAESVQAASLGRDPLLAVRDTVPHSRLSAALQLHVADLSHTDRECLAFIHATPHISRADATRFLPPDAVRAMLAAGLLHSDDSAAEHLTANELLAQEATRQLGPGRVDALVDVAATRMLAASEEWWSTPLSVAVGERWHRGVATAMDAADLGPAVRARVALDAARHANDIGDVAHALAHAARGLSIRDSAELRMEHAFAGAVLDAGVPDPLGDIDPESLDRVGRRRLVRLRAVLADRGFSAPLVSATEGDEDSEVENALDRAGRHGERLNWPEAAREAETVAARRTASAPARLRALLTAGMAHAFAGDWTAALERFHDAERVLDARTRPPGIGATDRLAAILLMLSSYQLAGADGAGVHERLVAERLVAARERDVNALILAGVGAAVADTNVGRPASALRELETARERGPRSLATPDIALVDLGVAEALAAAGSATEARAILDRAEPGSTPHAQHSRASVEATVLIAENRRADAVRRAREAAALTRGKPAPAQRLRDLFKLLILDVIEDDERAELHRLIADTDLPLASVAARRVKAWEARESTDPAAELRLHPEWSSTEQTTAAQGVGRLSRLPLPGVPSPTGAVGELTRREREIALLVDEGHTNREIATRLYLSVRTVESHVYQARAKVGATSRADLGSIVARWAASRSSNGSLHRA